MKEIVSSNIQLLYARRPRPALNWFLTEREASLSTDTQPCFPHLPHPTQITPPSALPHRIAPVPNSPPFFPLLSSALLSSPRQTTQLSAVGIGPRLPYSVFNLSLISLHCNGKWFLCFTIWLGLWARPSPPWDSGCLGVGGVFNFAPAQIVFYQRIHISNMILHINQAVCEWPNRKTARSGEGEIEPERKMKTGFHSQNLSKKLRWIKRLLRDIFHCDILKQENVECGSEECLSFTRKVFFSRQVYTIIIKTFTIVPLIKPHREGIGLINTSYSGDYCLL